MRLRQAFVEADEMAAVPVALTASEKHLLRAIIGTYSGVPACSPASLPTQALNERPFHNKDPALV